MVASKSKTCCVLAKKVSKLFCTCAATPPDPRGQRSLSSRYITGFIQYTTCKGLETSSANHTKGTSCSQLKGNSYLALHWSAPWSALVTPSLDPSHTPMEPRQQNLRQQNLTEAKLRAKHAYQCQLHELWQLWLILSQLTMPTAARWLIS